MTDEEIRQAGFNFIPPQRFLASPFEISENQEEPVVDEGIVATNAFVGGGGGGNDLTKITNLNYDPYRYRLAADIDEGSEEEYYTRPEPTGLGKLVQLAGSFVPGRGVASFIGDFLPVSRRAILENELAGEGVLVDDIGRIVQGKGDYNTAENVMAGYNPYAMTAETFDKRIARIQDTLEKKYGDRNYTGDKTKLDERIKAIEEAKQNFLDAQGRTDTIYDFEKEEKEKKKKDNILFKLFGKKDKQDITTSSADGAGGAVTTTDTSATSQGDGGGIDISGAGVIRSAQNAFKGDSGPTTQQEADYGYGSDYGFAKGGRVYLNLGGLVSIL